jgi:hypothetical protein
MTLQEIIKSALLGTEKYLPNTEDPLLQEVQQQITQKQEDKEDGFLKLAAAFFLMQEAGRKLPTQSYRHENAPTEAWGKISEKAAFLVASLIKGQQEQALLYALERCRQKQKLLSPDLVPVLLEMALKQKQIRSYLDVCGSKGRWLAGINTEWAVLYQNQVFEEDVWETGSLPARISWLEEQRKQDPGLARELLEAALSAESAANRAQLLEVLLINLSEQDLDFLERQCQDKSQKVKQIAYQLLRRLPGAQISRQYQAFLKETLSLREERHLLISKKKVLHFKNEAVLPEALIASGIEKISSQKGVEDVHYWVAQLMGYTPSAFWQQTFSLGPEELVTLFSEHPQKQLFLSALSSAALFFEDKAMAEVLLQKHWVNEPGLLQLVEREKRFEYAQYFLEAKQQSAELLQQLMDETYIAMPVNFCKKYLSFLQKEPYTLSQPMYQQWALYVPESMLAELRKLSEKSSQDYRQHHFQKMMSVMIETIETREKIKALIP